MLQDTTYQSFIKKFCMSIYIYIYKEIKYKRPYWIKFNKIGVNF